MEKDRKHQVAECETYVRGIMFLLSKGNLSIVIQAIDNIVPWGITHISALEELKKGAVNSAEMYEGVAHDD